MTLQEKIRLLAQHSYLDVDIGYYREMAELDPKEYPEWFSEPTMTFVEIVEGDYQKLVKRRMGVPTYG